MSLLYRNLCRTSNTPYKHMCLQSSIYYPFLAQCISTFQSPWHYTVLYFILYYFLSCMHVYLWTWYVYLYIAYLVIFLYMWILIHLPWHYSTEPEYYRCFPMAKPNFEGIKNIVQTQLNELNIHLQILCFHFVSKVQFNEDHQCHKYLTKQQSFDRTTLLWQ